MEIGLHLPCVNLSFKRHLLLNHLSKLKKFHMNVTHYALNQNCINGSTPLNTRAAKALDKKSFKRHLLNHWSKFKIKIHRIVPHDAFY